MPTHATGRRGVRADSRTRGDVVIWQTSNRCFALAIDVAQEMSVTLTAESGPIEGTRVDLRPALGRQTIRLPSPQPLVMLVADAR